jgi:hypothetical protein
METSRLSRWLAGPLRPSPVAQVGLAQALEPRAVEALSAELPGSVTGEGLGGLGEVPGMPAPGGGAGLSLGAPVERMATAPLAETPPWREVEAGAAAPTPPLTRSEARTVEVRQPAPSRVHPEGVQEPRVRVDTEESRRASAVLPEPGCESRERAVPPARRTGAVEAEPRSQARTEGARFLMQEGDVAAAMLGKNAAIAPPLAPGAHRQRVPLLTEQAGEPTEGLPAPASTEPAFPVTMHAPWKARPPAGPRAAASQESLRPKGASDNGRVASAREQLASRGGVPAPEPVRSGESAAPISTAAEPKVGLSPPEGRGHEPDRPKETTEVAPRAEGLAPRSEDAAPRVERPPAPASTEPALPVTMHAPWKARPPAGPRAAASTAAEPKVSLSPSEGRGHEPDKPKERAEVAPRAEALAPRSEDAAPRVERSARAVTEAGATVAPIMPPPERPSSSGNSPLRDEAFSREVAAAGQSARVATQPARLSLSIGRIEVRTRQPAPAPLQAPAAARAHQIDPGLGPGLLNLGRQPW